MENKSKWKTYGSGDAHILQNMDLSKAEPENVTTDRTPHQNDISLGTRESINSCLVNLHAQGEAQLYNSNIQNMFLWNIVHCPAGKRATHACQNKSAGPCLPGAPRLRV